jgi:hypothetical protein
MAPETLSPMEVLRLWRGYAAVLLVVRPPNIPERRAGRFVVVVVVVVTVVVPMD